jgi:hypothetical protein
LWAQSLDGQLIGHGMPFLFRHHSGAAGVVPHSPTPSCPRSSRPCPNRELAYFELGALFYRRKMQPESLEKAKTLAPDHDAVCFQLSQAYRRARRVQEAGQALAAYQYS